MTDVQLGTVPTFPAPRHGGRGPLSAEDRITLPTPALAPRRSDPDVGVPSAAGLPRPRLTAAVARVLDARICAVVAPAGAGKTTALAHWARQAAADVAWFRAGPASTDLVVGLAAAVQHGDPHTPRATGWDTLVDTCARRTEPLVLVVDDLHHLGRRTEVGEVLERLLLEAPRVHLVVASRTPPPLNLARTELASTVLGAADLRFRPAETAALFQDAYALPLTGDDARVLTRRTGGWPAALHLFRHVVAGRPAEVRRRAVHALGPRDEYAREYLAHTVLGALDPRDVRFLRETAALEALTGELCDRVRGETGSAERLRSLRGDGVLLASDVGPGSRLPEVVRSHLLAAARAEHGDRATDLRLRAAAAVLASSADLDPTYAAASVRASAAGRDWSAVRATAAERWAEVVGDPDLDWVDAVPAAAADGAVHVARAVRAVRDGALDAATAWIERAGSHLDPGDPTDPVGLTAAEVRTFCRTWTVGDLQPGDRWTDHLRAAVRRPQPDRRTRLHPAHADLLRAFEHALAGSWHDARELLRRCTGRLDGDLAASCAADLLALVLGHPDAERADAVATRAEDGGLTWLARLAHAVGCAHRGDVATAAAATSGADDRGDRWGALLLAATAAAGELRVGAPAARTWDDLVARCRDLEAPALEAWARSGAALAAAALHLPDASRDAESAIGYAHSAQVPGALVLAHAAAALVAGRALDQAADEADRIGLDVRPWEWVAPDDAPPAATASTVAAPRPAPPIEVRCFGGFEVRVDGVAPDLARVRPRARALLRLLALHAGQPVHREVIVDAMWPQLDGSAATHNLHVCVSGLRSALEPGVARGASRLLVRDGERYLLVLPDGATSDLRDFDRLTAAAERSRNAGRPADAVADLETALGLYVGDVLPEDGPTEWVLPHREQYKVRAAEAAALLGRLHLDRGRPDEAAAAARRSIDVDPCRDASWRLLVAAHEAAGDLAASEEARRSYADVLASLGVVATAARRV